MNRNRKRHFHPSGPDPAFICEHCRQTVAGAAPGTDHRNHCPWCLWSLHVDLRPGDRRCGCKGPMEPIAIWVRRGGEWAILHRCTRCAAVRANRIAGDDNELALMSLAVRPLAAPPFPLDRLGRAAACDQPDLHGQETPPPPLQAFRQAGGRTNERG